MTESELGVVRIVPEETAARLVGMSTMEFVDEHGGDVPMYFSEEGEVYYDLDRVNGIAIDRFKGFYLSEQRKGE